MLGFFDGFGFVRASQRFNSIELPVVIDGVNSWLVGLR
jgi:hypothetical protein